MKKRLSILLLTLLLCCCTAFSEESSPYIAVWETLPVDGQSVVYNAVELMLFDDGYARIRLINGAVDTVIAGSWEVDAKGQALVSDKDGNSIVFTLREDDMLCGRVSGRAVALTRSDRVIYHQRYTDTMLSGLSMEDFTGSWQLTHTVMLKDDLRVISDFDGVVMQFDLVNGNGSFSQIRSADDKESVALTGTLMELPADADLGARTLILLQSERVVFPMLMDSTGSLLLYDNITKSCMVYTPVE